MAKKRRRRRKASKRRAVVHANPRRRRRRSSGAVVRHRRRRASRNPLGLRMGTGIVGQFVDTALTGLRDGAVGTVSLGLARFVRGKVGLEGNTIPGIALEAVLGTAQAVGARRFFGADVARAAAQGVFQGIITTAVKGANVPVLSPALGDEGELPLLSGVYDLQGVYDLGDGDTLPLLSGVSEGVEGVEVM